MKKELITAIYNSILIENFKIYKDLLEKTKIGSKTTKYWIETLNFYERMSETDKSVLLKIIEQTMIDTISNMLGIIDGSSTAYNFDKEIKLTIDGHDVDGDLQDLFLELVE